MGERGGGVYARLDARPHTRRSHKKPRRSYAKGVPGIRIHQFEAGNRLEKDKFEIEVSLVSKIPVQIKHNALEAARIAITKTMAKGGADFFLKIRTYPHHILRENPMATGAGADRFQEGMRRSYGKPIGMAARVKKGQKVLSVRVNRDNQDIAKDALRKAKMKFPMACSYDFVDLKPIVKEE